MIGETIGERAETWAGPVGMGGASVEPGLIERIRRGDEAAYETLVRDNGGRLLAVARRYLRSEEDARDAVQDAFISAYKAIGRFEGGASLSTWLHRIVINCCLMRLRSSRRKPEESIEGLLPTFDETGHRVLEPAAAGEPEEERLDRGKVRARVRECIDRLPEKYRSVLMLRDIDEMSTEEAARALGTTPTAVKVRLHRARQALKTLLEPVLERGGE
ncbi:MAG TPA: sigma-70 family RNA polymerase sigma factor [Thermoanaerobaculia bacterium]|nr:sigma-70 family RNA polymerase sigma factor [Thermoanaerobaculia bacterium]